MARRAPDGESTLVFAPDGTFADPEAPTAVELNDAAVILLSPSIIDYDFPESGQTVDTADIGSSFNKTDVGTFGGDTATINFHRDSVEANDVAWASLPRLTRGFFCERLFGGQGVTFAADDIVDVYPGAVSARSMQQRQRNTSIRGMVSIAMTDDPVHDVTIVAGS